MAFVLPSEGEISANKLSHLPYVSISDKAIRYRVNANPNLSFKELVAPANRVPPKPGRKHPWFKEKKAAAEL